MEEDTDDRKFFRELGYVLMWCILVWAIPVLIWKIGPYSYLVVVGWIPFLWRVLPGVQVDGTATMIALLCSGFLLVGLHLFLRWLYRAREVSDAVIDSRRWKPRWTASLVAVVVLMFLAGTSAVGLTHQVAWLLKSPGSLEEVGWLRMAAARVSSQQNLGMIGHATIDYPRRAGTQLAGVTFDSTGSARHGWQTMLLPHFEGNSLFEKIDLTVPWDHPRNAPPFQGQVWCYTNPLIAEREDPEGYALSHYAGNLHILGNDVAWKMKDIPDGAGNTILAGEVSTALRPWGYPLGSRDPALGLYNTPQSFGGPLRSQATQFVMADGSVRAIGPKVDRAVLEALATPDGGEVVEDR